MPSATPVPTRRARSDAFQEATRQTPSASPRTTRGIDAAKAERVRLSATGR